MTPASKSRGVILNNPDVFILIGSSQSFKNVTSFKKSSGNLEFNVSTLLQVSVRPY